MNDTTKLTVNSSPSEQVTAAAKREFIVTDSTGRALTIRKPPFTAQFDLVALLGERARNQVYHTMIMPLTYVVAINGDPVTFPTSEPQLRFLIQRIDEHGYEAIADGITRYFGSQHKEEVETALKNS